MKVAYLIADGVEGKGGIERLCTYLFREMGRSFPDISRYVRKTRFTSCGFFKHLSTPIAYVLFVFDCLSHRFDVAHVHVAPKGSTLRKLLFARTAQFFGRKVVLHLHGSGYDVFFKSLPGFAQKLVRLSFQAADAVIVLGDYWADFAKNVLCVSGTKLNVIQNGVPEAVCSAPVKTNADIVHIAFLGQVGERKGVDVLLQALAMVRENSLVDKKWTVSIAGNGEVERFSALAEQFGLKDVVSFLGWVDEKGASDLLDSSDFFVLPSRAENQPVAILEAMARKLPVISTKIGAIPEQIDDNKTGLLVEPGNVEELGLAIEKLLCDPALRVQFGLSGYEKFKSVYSIESCAKKTVDVYFSVLR